MGLGQAGGSRSLGGMMVPMLAKPRLEREHPTLKAANSWSKHAMHSPAVMQPLGGNPHADQPPKGRAENGHHQTGLFVPLLFPTSILIPPSALRLALGHAGGNSFLFPDTLLKSVSITTVTLCFVTLYCSSTERGFLCQPQPGKYFHTGRQSLP